MTPTYNNWIPVSPDSMPEAGEYVLLLFDNGWNWLKGRWMNNGWVALYADGEHLVKDNIVTHFAYINDKPSSLPAPSGVSAEEILKNHIQSEDAQPDYFDKWKKWYPTTVEQIIGAMKEYARQSTPDQVPVEVRDELLKALKYFTDRVEAGTIKSKTTYSMYKEILERLSPKI